MMLVGEASRQYQVALEARRTLREQASGLVSFGDVLDQADQEVDASLAQLDQAWLQHVSAARP